MLKLKKQQSVALLEDIYKNFNSIIITHYHGLSVSQMTSIRKSLREDGAGFKVIKNTLSKIAGRETAIDSNILNLFAGPTAIAYSNDSISTVKKLVEFAKNNDKFKLIGAVVEEESLDVVGLQQLAKLPSMNNARAELLGVLQAPASGFHQLLQIYISNNSQN